MVVRSSMERLRYMYVYRCWVIPSLLGSASYGQEAMGNILRDPFSVSKSPSIHRTSSHQSSFQCPRLTGLICAFDLSLLNAQFIFQELESGRHYVVLAYMIRLQPFLPNSCTSRSTLVFLIGLDWTHTQSNLSCLTRDISGGVIMVTIDCIHNL